LCVYLIYIARKDSQDNTGRTGHVEDRIGREQDREIGGRRKGKWRKKWGERGENGK
jgi:hypothetical protein